MNRWETMHQLRVDVALANIPIIALTALATLDDRERCLTAGMNAYLTKPVGLKLLINMIQRLLMR